LYFINPGEQVLEFDRWLIMLAPFLVVFGFFNPFEANFAIHNFLPPRIAREIGEAPSKSRSPIELNLVTLDLKLLYKLGR